MLSTGLNQQENLNVTTQVLPCCHFIGSEPSPLSRKTVWTIGEEKRREAGEIEHARCIAFLKIRLPLTWSWPLSISARWMSGAAGDNGGHRKSEILIHNARSVETCLWFGTWTSQDNAWCSRDNQTDRMDEVWRVRFQLSQRNNSNQYQCSESFTVRREICLPVQSKFWNSIRFMVYFTLLLWFTFGTW